MSDSASLEERVRELERRFAIMRDVESIRDLRRRYHERINEGRYGELVELFASDAQAHFAVPVGHGWVDAWVPKPGRR